MSETESKAKEAPTYLLGDDGVWHRMNDFLHATIANRYAYLAEEQRNRPPSQWELEGARKRGTVTETLFDGERYGSGWIPDRLDKAIAWLGKMLDSVPPKLRNKVKIEVTSETDYDSHNPRIEINYLRQETDEEWAARRADVERRQALVDAAREAKDREDFERLKAKFDGQ